MNQGMSPIDKRKWTEIAGAGFFILALVLLFYSTKLCFSNDIWYDELFTMGFIQQPVGQLLSLAARDVHPPLYYLIAKAVVEFVTLFQPEADAVIICKIVSVLPYGLLFVYAGTLVRRRYGLLCASLFAFCVISMPQLSGFTTEVRMYGWAMFFITAMFFHIGEIVLPESGKGTIWHWGAVVFYGMCAAYTHYFAAVSAGFLFLLLLLFLYLKRDKDWAVFLLRLKIWLVCGGLIVLGYLPWIPFAYRQITAVRENYWILPLESSVFGGCVKFLLKPSTGYMWLDYGIAVVLFGAAVLLAGFTLLRAFGRRKSQPGADGRIEYDPGLGQTGDYEEHLFCHRSRCLYVSLGMTVIVCTALFGILISVLMRPVFIYRYLLPASGCFWFGFAYFLSRQTGRKLLAVPVLILLLVTGCANYQSFSMDEMNKAQQMERTQKVLDDLPAEDMVVYNFDQVQAVTGYYRDGDSYLWGASPEVLISEMFPGVHAVTSADEIRNWLDQGRNVWFIGSGLSRESVLEEWKELGIDSTQVQDSLLLERYWFNLYGLSGGIH